jgi:hypothetical protein
MAVIKSTANKIRTGVSVANALEYVTNPKKIFAVTTQNCFGTGSNFAANLSEQFEIVRAANKNCGGILAHHYVQSFAPDDKITPEQAHEIGVKFAKTAAPNYRILIATHADRDHLHNHIIINSVNPKTGYKWRDDKNTLEHLREVSDNLCLEQGLSVIKNHRLGGSGLDQTTQQLAFKGKSWKINLVKDLDAAVENCKSKIEFIDFLNKRNYKVRYKNAHITITKNGECKGIRVDTLARQFGEKYTKENLEKAMGYFFPQTKIAAKIPETEKVKPSEKPAFGEFQRYEKFIFSTQNKKLKRFRKPKNFPANLLRSASLEQVFLKLFFYILLKFAKNAGFLRLKNLRFKRAEKIKIVKSVKTCGNISGEKLLKSDGKNFRAELDTLQFLKLAGADFFWCARINFRNRRAYVTVKEHSKRKLAETIGTDIYALESENLKIANRISHAELKKSATLSGEKLRYKIVNPGEFEQLKKSKLKFANFERAGGKINICFLPRDSEEIEKVIFSEKTTAFATKKAETETQKNSRINREIKSAAALAGEKPRYKIVSPGEFELLKKSGAKFAAFKKGEKINLVFLKSDEKKILPALKSDEIKKQKKCLTFSEKCCIM